MQLAASSSSRLVGRYSEWHQQATAAAASSSMQAEAEVRSSRKLQQKERMNFDKKVENLRSCCDGCNS